MDACVTMSPSKAPAGDGLRAETASLAPIPRFGPGRAALRSDLAPPACEAFKAYLRMVLEAQNSRRREVSNARHRSSIGATMALRTPLTRQQRARTSLQHHERTSVFRLIDAPLKPCHQNGIELPRRPSAGPARSAPTRRWKRRAGTCHQHQKAVPMTDSSHSMNLRGARPGVSVTQLRRRANVHDFTSSPESSGIHR